MHKKTISGDTCWIHIYNDNQFGIKVNYDPLEEGFSSKFDYEGDNLNEELPKLRCKSIIITTAFINKFSKDEFLPELRKDITTIKNNWID